MGSVQRASVHQATATASLIAACILSRVDSAFSDDLAWVVFLVGSELSKALLSFAVGLLVSGSARLYAWATVLWFLGQALVEAFAIVGPDGYSAHGSWEYVAFAILYGGVTIKNMLK